MTVQTDDLFLHLSLQGVEARRLFLSRSIYDLFGGTVGYGPMRGFRIDAESSWNAADLGSKMFGLYEQELLDLIQSRRNRKGILVNLGAADGYYGVGVVVNDLFAGSVCYETSEAGRQMIARTAALNNVTHRVVVRSHADSSFPDDLEAIGVTLSNCFVLCDIEGGEFDVFTDECISRLRHSTLLIELHEFQLPDDAARCQSLLERLGRAFRLTFTTTGSRDLSGFPELASICDSDRWLICSEGRSRLMKWVLCEPR